MMEPKSSSSRPSLAVLLIFSCILLSSTINATAERRARRSLNHQSSADFVGKFNELREDVMNVIKSADSKKETDLLQTGGIKKHLEKNSQEDSSIQPKIKGCEHKSTVITETGFTQSLHYCPTIDSFTHRIKLSLNPGSAMKTDVVCLTERSRFSNLEYIEMSNLFSFAKQNNYSDHLLKALLTLKIEYKECPMFETMQLEATEVVDEKKTVFYLESGTTKVINAFRTAVVDLSEEPQNVRELKVESMKLDESSKKLIEKMKGLTKLYLNDGSHEDAWVRPKINGCQHKSTTNDTNHSQSSFYCPNLHSFSHRIELYFQNKDTMEIDVICEEGPGASTMDHINEIQINNLFTFAKQKQFFDGLLKTLLTSKIAYKNCPVLETVKLEASESVDGRLAVFSVKSNVTKNKVKRDGKSFVSAVLEISKRPENVRELEVKSMDFDEFSKELIEKMTGLTKREIPGDKDDEKEQKIARNSSDL